MNGRAPQRAFDHTLTDSAYPATVPRPTAARDGFELKRVADTTIRPPARCADRRLRCCLPGLVNQEPAQGVRAEPAEHSAELGEGRRHHGH
jgi:hypothetical protein